MVGGECEMPGTRILQKPPSANPLPEGEGRVRGECTCKCRDPKNYHLVSGVLEMPGTRIIRKLLTGKTNAPPEESPGGAKRGALARYSALVNLSDRRFMAFQLPASVGFTVTVYSPGCLISTWPRLTSWN